MAQVSAAGNHWLEFGSLAALEGSHEPAAQKQRLCQQSPKMHVCTHLGGSRSGGRGSIGKPPTFNEPEYYSEGRGRSRATPPSPSSLNQGSCVPASFMDDGGCGIWQGGEQLSRGIGKRCTLPCWLAATLDPCWKYGVREKVDRAIIPDSHKVTVLVFGSSSPFPKKRK